jgi:hypothetical protein
MSAFKKEGDRHNCDDDLRDLSVPDRSMSSAGHKKGTQPASSVLPNAKSLPAGLNTKDSGCNFSEPE